MCEGWRGSWNEWAREMQGLVFDPTDLGEDVTPQAAQGAVRQGAYLRGLLIALRLKDAELCHHAILSTPPSQVTPHPLPFAPPFFSQASSYLQRVPSTLLFRVSLLSVYSDFCTSSASPFSHA